MSARPESEGFARPHLARPLPVIKWQTKRVLMLLLVQSGPLKIQTLPHRERPLPVPTLRQSPSHSTTEDLRVKVQFVLCADFDYLFSA